MASKRIAIVTGACGFLARNLIPSLVDLGWHVIGVSREGRAGDANETLTWDEFWSGDIVGTRAIKAVFHLAACIPPDMEDSVYAAECLNANGLLTLRLAELIAAHGAARFVHCSSGQIYRYQTHAATEYQPVLPLRRACFYLSSKLLGEIYVDRTRALLGLDAITFRIGSCYGPWMPEKSLVSRFAALAREGKPLVVRHGGLERFDLVYVDDVVQFLIHGAISKMQGVFNVGSGRAVTVREVAEAVNRIFGNKAGVLEDMASGPAPQRGFAPLSMKRTTAAFGLKPRVLSKGLSDLHSWLETSRVK